MSVYRSVSGACAGYRSLIYRPPDCVDFWLITRWSFGSLRSLNIYLVHTFQVYVLVKQGRHGSVGHMVCSAFPSLSFALVVVVVLSYHIFMLAGSLVS